MNKNGRQKTVFTTGEVARLLGVNINTVIKWFEEGKLQGFRLPGSNDRRIPLASLRKFMVTNSIPMDLLQDEGPMRRAFERVTCDDMVEFTAVNGKTYGPFPGKLDDVSLGGARIVVNHEDARAIPMQSCFMYVRVKDGGLNETAFAGRVVHLHAVDDSWAIGMKFEQIEEPHKQRLANFIDYHFA